MAITAAGSVTRGARCRIMVSVFFSDTVRPAGSKTVPLDSGSPGLPGLRMVPRYVEPVGSGSFHSRIICMIGHNSAQGYSYL